MPDLDGGHYFFTALLPIDNHGIVEHGPFKSSAAHMVRDALEALPTALQTREAEKIGIQSPFARSLRTHFVRIFVIDAPAYNGRDSGDTLISTLKGINPLQAQPVDRLACPYLAFVGDFDPAADGAEEPRSWLEELWRVAKPELCSVFQYCYQFQADADGTAFADFVLKGQVETTMSFNDYWTIPPPIPNLSGAQLAIAPAVGLLAALGFAAMGHWPWWAGLGLSLAMAAGGVVFDYFLINYLGGRPFPTAPNSTLRDVLKALYLQQAFTRFAGRQQGASPDQLRAAFADFVAATRPNDLAGPTQPPGVIRSPEVADA
ncbi:MAG TPA: hypothetical protein VKQ70_17115 [Caulobacteraceae bacterium]|jgi:hypothetical protein|nr:hypothetical protein [Caulobacteraceae bacterium]